MGRTPELHISKLHDQLKATTRLYKTNALRIVASAVVLSIVLLGTLFDRNSPMSASNSMTKAARVSDVTHATTMKSDNWTGTSKLTVMSMLAAADCYNFRSRHTNDIVIVTSASCQISR